MPRFTPDDVRRFYDRSTPAFVRYGQGGRAGTIHRAVWGPGATTRDQAFHFVEHHVLSRLSQGHGATHVLDLGCGIGASLACLLSARADTALRGTGVTLSPLQARLAREWARAHGLADRLTIVEADFTALPASIRDVDLAYAIESFVHATDPRAFFREAARVLRPGGRLLICDDVDGGADTPAAIRARERFVRGWHINTLLQPEALVRHAAAEGFRHLETMDLTPWLELGRPRDRLAAAFVALCGWLPLARTPLGHLVGGSALQSCLRRGWVRYELAEFVRE
ncbi:MAG: cyclopropane-fatty-acyl-phospholipid synthase family protein [Vicinamibacterales bacterium]